VEVKENRRLSNVGAKRLVFFTGKGGVGKTSVSAAFGLAAARAKKRVLLAEIRSPGKIPPLFGITPAGNGPLSLGPRLDWRNLTPADALQTYAMRMLKLRSVYRAVFEQRAVRRFLRAVPALSEILMLGHLAYLVEQGDYDLIVTDAPSSGPGALMFGAPRSVLESVSRGPLYDGAAWIQSLIADRDRCAVNIVVLPEELPVTESVDLYHRLKDDLGLPIGTLVANRTLDDPYDKQIENVCRIAAGIDIGRSLAESCRLHRMRLRLQEICLDRLRAGIDLPCVYLPEILNSTGDADTIEQISAAFEIVFSGRPAEPAGRPA